MTTKQELLSTEELKKAVCAQTKVLLDQFKRAGTYTESGELTLNQLDGIICRAFDEQDPEKARVILAELKDNHLSPEVNKCYLEIAKFVDMTITVNWLRAKMNDLPPSSKEYNQYAVQILQLSYQL
jgi:hypothetical protein